jgi:predicted HTH domain antitoxin
MYTERGLVYTMKSITLSFRMEADEVRSLDESAARDGLDRASLIKRLLRRGYAEYRFEAACAAYRRGEVSLSRAAEMAGIGLYDLLNRFPAADLHLNLTAEDLRRELAS